MKLTFACGIVAFSLAITGLAADAQDAVSTKVAGGSGTNVDIRPEASGDHYTNSIGMELVKVGTFWAGKYEVTQKDFQKVMGSNPSGFQGGSRPVDSVNWNDAMDFCAKLTEQQVKDKKLPEGYFYTLPTEGEWQGLMADASLNDSVTSLGTKRGGTSPVGSLAPNKLGLFDMRGNVMEFCLGDASQAYRVLLGGSWQDWIEINLRPEFRFYCTPSDRKNTFGFRCLLKKQG